MACADVELCEKVDTMQTSIDTLNETLTTISGHTLQSSTDTPVLVDYVSQTNGYIFFIIVGLITYFIVSWIFKLFKDIALNW